MNDQDRRYRNEHYEKPTSCLLSRSERLNVAREDLSKIVRLLSPSERLNVARGDLSKIVGTARRSLGTQAHFLLQKLRDAQIESLESKLEVALNPWKSSDEKPEVDCLVLIRTEAFERDGCHYAGNVWLGSWSDSFEEFLAGWSLSGDQVGCEDHVVQWMYIPA